MQPFIEPSHSAFINKLRMFHIYNALFLAYCLIQMILFAVTTASLQCANLHSLFVSWTICYVVEMLVPASSIVCTEKRKYFLAAYGALGIAATYKLAVIITVFAVAWKHVGLCYVTNSMKWIVVGIGIIEIGLMAINLILLRRIKKINREVLVTKLINSKEFPQ